MNTRLFVKKLQNKLFHTDVRAYRKWFLARRADRSDIYKESTAVFAEMPLISVLVPVYKTPLPFLHEMISSVVAQTYTHWELIVVNATPGGGGPLSERLNRWAQKDNRIKVYDLPENKGISGNTNAAFALANGEFVALFDHDDVLEPDALYEYVKAYNHNPELDMFYCDEDKITEKSEDFFFPNFKPDYNPDMLYAGNYICHFLMVRKTLAEQAGLWNPDFDGAQDFDFILRCTEISERIYHVPRILYHWRSHSGSTAKSQGEKSYASEAGKRALKAHFDRVGIPVRIEDASHPGWYHVHYPEVPQSEITEVVVPSGTLYEKMRPIWATLRVPKGKYILLRGVHTAPLTAEQQSRLAGPLCREDVGICGAKIMYQNHETFRCGYHQPGNGILRPYFLRLPEKEVGYMMRAVTTADVAVVSVECLMVKRDLLLQIAHEMETLYQARKEEQEDSLSGILAHYCYALGKRVCNVPEVMALTDRKPSHKMTEKVPKGLFDRMTYKDPGYNRNLSDMADFELK